MNAIFLQIWDMSITASLAILAVMAVRWLLRKQPKIYSYVLWSIVLFRLLCPYSISFDASVFNALPPAQTTNGQIEYYINQPVDFSDTRQEIPGDETVVPDIVIADRLAINTPQQLNIQENIIVKNLYLAHQQLYTEIQKLYQLLRIARLEEQQTLMEQQNCL